MQEESQGADSGLVKEEEVLRASEGHQKRASDRCDIFHGDDRKDAFFPFDAAEEKDGERDKYDKRHIVGHKHRCAEYSEYEEERKARHGPETGAELEKRLEQVFLLEAFEHGKHHEEDTEGMPVDSTYQFF